MPRHGNDDDLDEEGQEQEEPFEDWDQPSWWQSLLPLVAALIVGIIMGLVIGAQVFTASGIGDATTESYLVLASELYRQGEDIETIRQHFDAIGIYNPATILLQQADSYLNSSDLIKKRQSEDLRQLGNAFLTAGGTSGTPANIVQTTPIASPTAKNSTAQTPATEVIGSQTGSPTKTTSVPPVPTKTKEAPTATAITAIGQAGQSARITSSGGEGAMLRKQPATSADVLTHLNHGAQVFVLEIVNGEAIDEAEPRWYKVKYNDMIGYVYFKLIALGE